MLCNECKALLAGEDGAASHSHDCQLWSVGFCERLNLLGRLDHPVFKSRLLEYQLSFQVAGKLHEDLI